MTDLTEQCKTHYYIKFPNNKVIIGDEFALSLYRNCKDGDKVEVLSEVPSFEEWQASEKYNKHLEEKIKIYERKDKQATETSIAYNELLTENAILKELLKDCREILFIEEMVAGNPRYIDELRILIKKIDQVLANNKIQADTVACNKIQENE